MSGQTIYRICFRLDHVSANKECTSIPYGDDSLYNASCWPRPIITSYIRQEAFEDARDVRTTRAKRVRTILDDDLRTAEKTDQLEADQWVLVRGKYIGARGNGYDVEFNRPDGINPYRVLIRTDEVIAVTDGPIPAQPNQTSLLASIKSGRIFRWVEPDSSDRNPRKPGWRHLVNDKPLSWEQLYKEEGPFQEYKTDGEV